MNRFWPSCRNHQPAVVRFDQRVEEKPKPKEEPSAPENPPTRRVPFERAEKAKSTAAETHGKSSPDATETEESTKQTVEMKRPEPPKAKKDEPTEQTVEMRRPEPPRAEENESTTETEAVGSKALVQPQPPPASTAGDPLGEAALESGKSTSDARPQTKPGGFDVDAPNSVYHATLSDALAGIESVGALVPASELAAEGIVRTTGEGPQFGFSVAEKNSISLGQGAEGFGVAQAYSDLYQTSGSYNPALLDESQLDAEIVRLRVLTTDKDWSNSFSVSKPFYEGTDRLGFANKALAETRLRQLQAERDLRSRPAGRQPSFPVVFEFDGPSLSAQPKFNLPGEVAAQRAGLEHLKRVFVPEINVAEMQARMDQRLGHGRVEVLSLESAERAAAGSCSAFSARTTVREKLSALAKDSSDLYGFLFRNLPAKS